jgi:hypothetical protein
VPVPLPSHLKFLNAENLQGGKYFLHSETLQGPCVDKVDGILKWRDCRIFTAPLARPKGLQ